LAIEFIRAEGTPGDSDRYPRVNVVARLMADHRAPACISIRILTSSNPAPAGPSIRSPELSGMARSMAAAPAT
jgi:hypothetical protein